MGERYKTKSNGSCGRYVATTAARAECLCGWSEHADDRAEAQGSARAHRRTVEVEVADLAAFTRFTGAHAIPVVLFAALGRLDDLAAAASAGGQHTVAAPLVDLRPLLRQMNRPWAYAELRWLPRLIAAVDAASASFDRVGMLDSTHGWCQLLADSHELTFDEWLRRVTPGR